MKGTLAASVLLTGGLVVSSTPAAYAPPAAIMLKVYLDPSCVSVDEFDRVEDGMTRLHVQQDIYDGYEGWTFWTSETDNAAFQYKNYNKCAGDKLFQVKFRLDTTPDSDGKWRVVEKNVYDPDSRQQTKAR